jgi:NADPH-dependent ferric siderophore reductase
MTVISPFGAESIEAIEHLNEEHDDTIAFLASVAIGSEVAGARIAAVDHSGLTITVDGSPTPARIGFGNEVTSPDDLYANFYALLGEARRRAADRPLTSLERDLQTTGKVRTFVTAVTDVRDLTPRLRQITVAGGLDDFSPLAPDQFVYVLAPPAGCKELTIDSSFSWEAYQEMPAGERPVGAYYTIRRFDPDRRAIELWVVLHGHHGDGESWARRAAPGDPVALWGPRDAYDRPSGCTSVVLLGDETALPAIAAIAETLDGSCTATVVLELHDPAHAIEITSPAALAVHTVSVDRDGPNPLLAFVQQHPDLLGERTYLWGGGESRDLSAIRRFARSTAGLTREQVCLTGYWRRTAG